MGRNFEHDINFVESNDLGGILGTDNINEANKIISMSPFGPETAMSEGNAVDAAFPNPRKESRVVIWDSFLSFYILPSMMAFVVRRLLLTVPVVWIVVTLVFSLIHIVPGDPVAQMLGEGAAVTQVEQMRHDLGLDRPFLAQYRGYIAGLLHGDLGTSFRFQQTVASSIAARYPATIELAIAATIFSVCGSETRIHRG